MATLVFGMNQSLHGYVDHMAFEADRTLFRHFIAEARDKYVLSDRPTRRTTHLSLTPPRCRSRLRAARLPWRGDDERRSDDRARCLAP